MYDMHYDLLTMIYFNFLKDNPKSDPYNMLISLINMYKNDNIKGGIINLYFDTKEAMEDEMGIPNEALDNVYDMFDRSLTVLEDLKKRGLIPKDINYLYSIEGGHHIKPGELINLVERGLRVLLPIYSHQSKSGCGTSVDPVMDEGLYEFGKEQIREAFNLGIAIDLSHASSKSFDDILSLTSEARDNDFNPIILASHSNCRSICDRPRNLTDEQIIKLKEQNGYLGLFTNCRFTYKHEGDEFVNFSERPKYFIKHLKHVIDDLNYPIEKIFISTDDMDFNPDVSYHNFWTFPLKNINNGLESIINEEYGSTITEMLLRDNSEKFIYKVKHNVLLRQKKR